MTRKEIQEELSSLPWKKLQTYCKDNNLDIKGLKKDEVIMVATKKRLADIETLSNNDSSEIEEKELTPIQKLTIMKTVTVQNLNPHDAKLPSKVITIGNMENGFPLPSYVVQFGVKQRLPNGVVKFLLNQQYRSSKTVKNEQGVPVTINVMKTYYQVIVHPE